MKKAKATTGKQVKKSAPKKQTKSLTKSSVKVTAKKSTPKVAAKSSTQIKTAKKQTSNVRPDKTVKSVQTGIEILNYATKNKTSISEASRKKGFGRNYVSDVKARIEKNYKKKSITRELYDSFKNTSKNYDKSIKK